MAASRKSARARSGSKDSRRRRAAAQAAGRLPTTIPLSGRIRPVDPSAPDKEKLANFMAQQKVQQFGEINSILDTLRRTRAERGGVGEPLRVPPHLQDAASGKGIIITDADINPDSDTMADAAERRAKANRDARRRR